MKKENVHIILASKSERRKDILQREGFDFEIYVPSGIEMDIIGKKYSEELVNECAKEKAENAYSELYGINHIISDDNGSQKSTSTEGSQSFAHTSDDKDCIIVSCDTVVVNDDVIIGKPKDKNDAMNILKSLSGRRHRVISAVCICKNGEYYVENDTTYVTFRKIFEEELE